MLCHGSRSGLQVVVLALILSAGAGGSEPGNLVDARYFVPQIKGKSPRSFWWPRSAGMSFEEGVLKLSVGDRKREACGMHISLGNMIAQSVNLSLMARVEKGSAVCVISFTSPPGKWMAGKSLQLRSRTWEKSTLEIPVKVPVEGVRLSFTAVGTGCELYVKDVSVTVREKRSSVAGKIKIRNGDEYVDCSGIYLVPGEPGQEFYDRLAAGILRRKLYEISGQILPLVRTDTCKPAPGMILVGRAATGAAGLDAKVMNTLRPGGFAYRIGKGVVALAGKRPAGVVSGVYALVENLLGVVFVDRYHTEPPLPTGKELRFETNDVVRSPAFALRLLRHGDSLGYSNVSCVGDARLIGCRSATTPHTIGGLIDFDKYHETHPEYFALGKDGLRLHRDPKSNRFDVHVCMSNPEVQKLVSEQVIEWMRKNPQAKYFWLSPGDGGGRFCRCEHCLAMDEREGIYTDRNLKFVNAVARLVADKFPDNVLLTLAYVDIEEPPVKTRPAPNVGIMYCPYPRNWSNHLEAFDKEYNAEGMRTLNGWLRLCPGQMYIFCYPGCCGEPLNLWPAFYANYEKFKYYAQHNVKGIYFCGLREANGGYPGHNSFNAMSRFVLGKVLWNPGLDVEKEIDRFMRLYYGPAAPRMRAFFDLIHREVRERHFVQHTEEVKRGFVTRELARKAYSMFAEAQKLAGGTPRYLDRVLREKAFLLFADLSDNCRTNGKIKEADLP